MGKKEKKLNQILYPFLFEIGYRISIPLILFVVLGVWLDKKFAAPNIFLFTGIFISLFTSSYAIYKTIKKVNKNN